jgi:hypothetical protein
VLHTGHVLLPVHFATPRYIAESQMLEFIGIRISTLFNALILSDFIDLFIDILKSIVE